MSNSNTQSTQELLNAMVLKMAELCIAHSDRAMTVALRPLMNAYKTALAEQQEAERRQRITHCGTRHFSQGTDHV